MASVPAVVEPLDWYPEWMRAETPTMPAMREAYAHVKRAVEADQRFERERNLALKWCRANGNPHLGAR